MRPILIAAALAMTASLPACQSSGSSTGATAAKYSKADPEACAKAKKDLARDTPMGQGKIKLACTSGMTAEDFAREIARHEGCRVRTGRVCAN